MPFWHLLMEILLLLGTAFVLGAVAQRLRQSATIGYLLAGMLLVRSRFQRACRDLEEAGATIVVDEENTVGRLLAHETLKTLELGQDAGLACALAGRSPAVMASPVSGKS